MHSAITQILRDIQADCQEGFLGANEMVRAHSIGLVGTSVMEPYFNSFSAEPIEPADIFTLKQALIEYLQSGQDQNAASAIHTLGALGDSELVPFLRERLGAHLKLLMREGTIVGSLIVALDSSGEEVITGKSYNTTRLEKNVADAGQYLGKFGITVPWG